MKQTSELVETITKGIQEKKGHDIVIANLQKIEGTICRYFVICQGQSPTQVDAIAGSVSDVVQEEMGEKPIAVSGLENDQWVAIDYADVMVHIFLPEQREYYDLEHLWDDAEITRLPDMD